MAGDLGWLLELLGMKFRKKLKAKEKRGTSQGTSDGAQPHMSLDKTCGWCDTDPWQWTPVVVATPGNTPIAFDMHVLHFQVATSYPWEQLDLSHAPGNSDSLNALITADATGPLVHTGFSSE